MNTHKTIILLVFIVILSYSITAFAQGRIPDLKGKWTGVSFLNADIKGIQPANNHVTLIILKQSGLEFNGTIEIQDKEITKMRNFSGSLDADEGYIWYFNIVTEGGVLNIGYLITKNIMKVNLRTFNPHPEIAICRLTRDKPTGE